jgi:hypothetical protein
MNDWNHIPQQANTLWAEVGICGHSAIYTVAQKVDHLPSQQFPFAPPILQKVVEPICFLKV